MGAGVGAVAMVTSTSSQFVPPLESAARTFTVPVWLPMVRTPVVALMVQPRALARIEKCAVRVEGMGVALICTVLAGPPDGDTVALAGVAVAFWTPVLLSYVIVLL